MQILFLPDKLQIEHIHPTQLVQFPGSLDGMARIFGPPRHQACSALQVGCLPLLTLLILPAATPSFAHPPHTSCNSTILSSQPSSYFLQKRHDVPMAGSMHAHIAACQQ
jgi:hypothetical protein